MEVVAQPLPPLNFLNRESRIAVCQREEEVPSSGKDGANDTTCNPYASEALTDKALACSQVLLGATLANLVFSNGTGREDELNESTRNKTRCKMGREIMMQEELTAHQVEWEVVCSPCKPEETSRVVKLGACALKLLVVWPCDYSVQEYLQIGRAHV